MTRQSSLSSECGRLSRSSSASTLRDNWEEHQHQDLTDHRDHQDLSDHREYPDLSRHLDLSDHRDHPDLSDLGSIADLSAKFTSLTAKKLMAGISIGSIDTLIEVALVIKTVIFIIFQVNAAANNNNNKIRSNHSLNRDNLFNESTETVDFGVI